MNDLLFFELHFPRDLTHEGALPFVRTLAARQRRGLLATGDPIVFEAHAQGGSLRWFLGITRRESGSLLAQLRTSLPGVRARERTTRPVVALSRGVEVRLNTTRRPLRFDEAETSAAALLTALHRVKPGEVLLLQWIIGPWLPRPVVKRIGPMKPGLGIERLVLALSMDTEDASTYRKKLAEPLLGATLRIAVRAGSGPRQRQLLQRVLGAFQLARQPGVGLVTRRLPSRFVLRRLRSLKRPLIAWPVPINAAELAALLGWPLGNPSLPGVEYAGHRQLPPTTGTTLALNADRAGKRVLGRATYPGQEGWLHLPPAAALHHLHIIGPTGTGKSTLLGGLIEADIAAGRGVVVIEPKGDLIAHVLDRLPSERLNDVVLLDPADTSLPVGLNVLACRPEEAELAVDQIVHVLRELYRDSWGPRTQDILVAGLLTLARVGGQSLCELPVLLTNASYRHRVLRKVDDPLALSPFWDWFESLRDGERTEVIGPVLNKLRAFTYRRTIRAMLGQTKPRFEMKQVFTQRKILLVNLAKGLIGPEASRLLGSLAFSALWQSALGRASIAPERRHFVPVYIDEFQDYLATPTDFSEVLAQARGVGLGLTLAHQHLAQLTPPIKAAVLANARSRIVFQSGSGDAAALASALGCGLTAADLQALGPYEIYAALMRGASPAPPASAETLAPTAAQGTAAQARSASRANYGRELADVEAELLARQAPQAGNESFGGKRRRPA